MERNGMECNSLQSGNALSLAGTQLSKTKRRMCTMSTSGNVSKRTVLSEADSKTI